MKSIFRTSAMLILGAAVFAGSYTWDGQAGSKGEVGLIAAAEARVGRPATPVSYAGVARRTTRRVVGTTAAVAAATPAPAPVVVVQPTTQTCVDVVDAYGNITRRCQ